MVLRKNASGREVPEQIGLPLLARSELHPCKAWRRL